MYIKEVIQYTDVLKYLEFTFNMDMDNFFIEKFKSVKRSFFSLNSFGFKPGGVNPYLQANVYKPFCISRLLYGLEIMNISKKTLGIMNVMQNDIIRYITGLS